MNGPEHYQEAERLLSNIARDLGDADIGPGVFADRAAVAPLVIAQAQVHATLALVAAQMENVMHGREMGWSQHPEWREAVHDG